MRCAGLRTSASFSSWARSRHSTLRTVCSFSSHITAFNHLPGDSKSYSVQRGASPVTTATNEKNGLSSHTVNIEKAAYYSHAHSKEALLSPDFDPKFLKIITQESILLGGGAAAIMLQISEAGVGAGVNEHSNFAHRAIDRLRTTMTYVYCMAYGTAGERKAVVDMVTRVHESVNGTLNEGRDAGRLYSALDPELQLWVAATLYWTAMEMYQNTMGEIRDRQLHDDIYKDYSILACSLQVPPEMWPATRDEFYTYWDGKIANIEITRHAHQITRDLLYDIKIPFFLKAAMPLVRVITAELLPTRIREGYGLERYPKIYRLFELSARAVYRPMPTFIRTIPVKYYMWDMRRRLRKNKKIFDKA
ncbi:oxygenase MpaB family protein [Microdochium nivale]|nr:oxygenase MpaB family protein [Microdochium nivale]